MAFVVAFPADYQERVVVFVDILGWSEAICDNSRKKDIFKAIFAMYDEVFWSNRASGLASAPDTFCTTFSDSLVLSCPAGSDAVGHVLQSVCRLYVELLVIGFMCRGGLVVGPAIHNERVVIGPALVHAVQLEKKARHPRIAVRESDIEKLRPILEDQDILRDTDETPYLNALLIQTPFEKLRREKIETIYPHWTVRLEAVRKVSAGSADPEAISTMAKHEWLVAHLRAVAEVEGVDLDARRNPRIPFRDATSDS